MERLLEPPSLNSSNSAERLASIGKWLLRGVLIGGLAASFAIESNGVLEPGSRTHIINQAFQAWLVLTILVWSARRLARWWGREPLSDACASRSRDPNVALVVRHLRVRAARLTYSGYVILVVLGIVIWLGFHTFTRAERSALESSREGWIVESLRSEIERDRRRLAAMIDDLFQLQKDSSSFIGETSKARMQVMSEQIKELRSDLRNREGSLQPLLAVAGRPRDEGREDGAAKYALSLLSTKLGAVLLLIFGAQILVTLYRYNARLSAFSDARADILQLAALSDLRNFRDLASMLNSDSLEFGKAPRSPVRDAVAFLGTTMGQFRKRPEEAIAAKNGGPS